MRELARMAPGFIMDTFDVKHADDEDPLAGVMQMKLEKHYIGKEV